MPEVASVSARDPASIQIPTVAVCRKGEYSVATERPFDRVVVCVGRMREFAGVASARVTRGVSEVERGRRTEETAFRVRADGMRSLEADITGLVDVPRERERSSAETIGCCRDAVHNRKDRLGVNCPRDALSEGDGDGDAADGR